MRQFFILSLLVTALLSFTFSENQGIKFESFTLEQAKNEARKTGKLIFIDVYTSWCGPCKMMSSKTFTDIKVGKSFNSSFINLKLDAEKSQDGIDAARAYAVNAYPTLIFITSEGKLVRKFVGYRSPTELLDLAEMVKK